MNNDVLKFLGEFIVLDLETTGLDPKDDEIIEIAMLKVKEGKVAEKLIQLVKPRRNELSHLVKHLTGLNEKELENAPSWEEIKEKIAAFAGELPVCGHHIDFDLEVLNQKGLKLRGQPLDTWPLSTVALLNLPAYSLEYLSDYLNLEKKPNHRAGGDVEANLVLLENLLRLLARVPREARRRILEEFPHLDWPWKEIWLKLPETKINPPEPISPSFEANPNIVEAISEELPSIKSVNVFALPPGFKAGAVLRGLSKKRRSGLLFLVPEPWLVRGDVPEKEVFWPKREIKKERWKVFARKQLNEEESVLGLKIALAEHYGIPLKRVSFNREESYIFEEHLSDFDKSILKKESRYLPASALESVLEQDLTDYTLVVPSLDFLERFALRRGSFTWTNKYLESTISKRRDFWQRLRGSADAKISDRLFKLTKDLSAVWQEMLASLSVLADRMEEKNSPDKGFLSPAYRASEEYQSVLKVTASAREILSEMNDLLKPLSTSKKTRTLLEKEIAWFVGRNEDLDEKISIIQQPSVDWSLWLSGWAGRVILRGYHLPAVKSTFERLASNFKALLVLEEGFAPNFWQNYLTYFWRENYTVKKLKGREKKPAEVLISPQSRLPRTVKEGELWVLPSLTKMREYFELAADEMENAESQETYGSLILHTPKGKPSPFLLTLGKFMDLTTTWAESVRLIALPFGNPFSPDVRIISHFLPNGWDDLSILKLGSRVAQFVGQAQALGIKEIIISDERLATASYAPSLIDYLKEAGIKIKVG